jgi:hypothetical protein
MADVQRVRVRERDPESGEDYERIMRYLLAIRDRSLTGKIVVRGADRPFKQNRQGLIKLYMSREVVDDTALKDWSVFVHEIHRHSGTHRHQGGIALFVLEGEGYTIVNGERIDWEAGDLILLPIVRGGCEHQHFNRHADRPCKWLAFIHKPMWDEIGSYIEQVETSPDYKG